MLSRDYSGESFELVLNVVFYVHRLQHVAIVLFAHQDTTYQVDFVTFLLAEYENDCAHATLL